MHINLLCFAKQCNKLLVTKLTHVTDFDLIDLMPIIVCKYSLIVHLYYSLMRREALLRGTETYFDTQENQAASFISDINKARQRNEELLRVGIVI